jgi:predicted Na+-dependent transporter
VPLVAALYLAFAIVSWHLAGSACLRLSAGDRVTALFASTQKTVAMGIPIISATFGSRVGTYAIPLMIYQIVQIVVPSMVIGRLRKYIKKRR